MTNDTARECGLLRREVNWKKGFQVTAEYLTICNGSLAEAAVLGVYVFRAYSDSADKPDDGCLKLSEEEIAVALLGILDRKTIRKARNALIERRILVENDRPGPHNARRCRLNRPLLQALIEALGSDPEKVPGSYLEKVVERRRKRASTVPVGKNSPTDLRDAEAEVSPTNPLPVGENGPTELGNSTQRSWGNMPNSYIGSKHSFKNCGKHQHQQQPARQILAESDAVVAADTLEKESVVGAAFADGRSYRAGTFALDALPFFAEAGNFRNGDDVADDHRSLLKNLNHPETQWWFHRMNASLVGSPLGSMGRSRILQACEREGFSLGKLHFAFTKHGGGLNRAGGLIRFAENWRDFTSAIFNWPDCEYCVDTGEIDYADSPFEQKVPCGCEVGERKRQSPAYAGLEAWLGARKEGQPYCHHCRNSGVVDNRTEFLTDRFCACELGREKYREAEQRQREAKQREREAHSAREIARERAQAEGICGHCFGEDPMRSACFDCNTSGRHFSQEELLRICGDCKGAGVLKWRNNQPCPTCKGTGRPIPRKGAVSSPNDVLLHDRSASVG